MLKWGIIRITVFVAFVFIVLYCLLRPAVAVCVFCGIMLYVLVGEYLAIKENGVVKLEYWYGQEHDRLLRIKNRLEFAVEERFQKNLGRIRLYIIQSEDAQICTYGFKRIAIPLHLIASENDDTLVALLSREVLHIYEKSSIFKRMISASIVPAVIAIRLSSFGVTSILWGIFFLLELLHIPKGAEHLFAWFIDIVEETILSFEKLLIDGKNIFLAAISRRSDFRADHYAKELGFGTHLCTFLIQQARAQIHQPKTRKERLFESHADIYKRIYKIAFA